MDLATQHGLRGAHSRTKSRIRLLGEGGTMSVAMKIEVNFFENVSENIRGKKKNN